eukprot:TRINITY_DN48817_c0_g1_i5.p2 TRINITY_DN48817_c0_g1~~TRINITY_DN48817_c0_g1_i5.p2  ORF type:complete len:140 (+),score=15.67 TRINITY_DN48817_c0_g1_i5:36-455(+)
MSIEMFLRFLLAGILALTSQGIEDVNFMELYTLLQAGAIDLMLDVRTPPEYLSGHIACASNQPVQTLEQAILSGQYDGYRNRTVGVICSAGMRSAIAANIFQEQGFEDIINTIQGMNTWIEAGLPYIQGFEQESDTCEE